METDTKAAPPPLPYATPLSKYLLAQACDEAFSYAWNRINNSIPHGVKTGDVLIESKNLGFTTHGTYLILGQEYPPNNVRYVVPVQIAYDVPKKTVISVYACDVLTPEDWEKAQRIPKA